MLSWALFCLGLLFVFLFYKIVFLFFDSKSDIKEAFGLPFYYSVVNHDLGKNPKKFYIKYNGVVGTPDAIFKMLKFPILVVGEVKSRNLHI
jgi:hypothetical protein